MISLFVLNSYFYKRIHGHLNSVFDVFRIVSIPVVLKYGFSINLNSRSRAQRFHQFFYRVQSNRKGYAMLISDRAPIIRVSNCNIVLRKK